MQRVGALNLGWPEVSRSLLIAVIGVEPIALIVLDAPQRRGIHLVQDHAQDPIQQLDASERHSRTMR